MNPRPTSVTVFAVINIILASLGVLVLTFFIILLAGLIPIPEDAKSPQMFLMETNPGYYWFTHMSIWLGLIMSILILAASIGMLMLATWARPTAILWCGYNIAITILSAAIDTVLIKMPALKSGTPHALRDALIGLIVPLLVIAYSALQIGYLTRPRITDAFTQANADDQLNLAERM